MEFPLFKGISIETANSFLERTPLHFQKFTSGSCIANPDCRCDEIRLILNGSARKSQISLNGDITIEATYQKNMMIGTSNLFGLHNTLDYSVKALTDCSVLDFSKASLIRLLHCDEIIMLNYLNYLAYKSHIEKYAFRNYDLNDPLIRLKYLVSINTSKKAVDITMTSVRFNIIELLFKDHSKAALLIQHLAKEGIAELKDEHTIHISDRRRLLT